MRLAQDELIDNLGYKMNSVGILKSEMIHNEFWTSSWFKQIHAIWKLNHTNKYKIGSGIDQQKFIGS